MKHLTAISPQSIHLRPAVPEDIPALYPLHRAAYQELVTKVWGPWDEEWQAANFRDHFDCTARQVILHGDTVVGYLDVVRHPDYISLAELVIAPEFQRRGIGTHLLQNLMAESLQSARPLKLQVLKINHALNWYQRLGFLIIGQTETHFMMQLDHKNPAARDASIALGPIVALGGGGFLVEPANPLLDRYILSLARAPRPKICFVPTASADSDNFCLRFYDAFARHDCVPTHLLLFKRQITDLHSYILEQDIIYVGGGNTANLLAIWRRHGLDKILSEARRQNIVLCGISAGSICWFEAGVTDSFGPTLAPLHNGLGLLPGSNCPHYDGETQRRPVYHRLVKEGSLPPGHAADDGCALHFQGDRLVRIVSSRPNARAYRVESRDGQVIETPLDSDFLG